MKSVQNHIDTLDAAAALLLLCNRLPPDRPPLPGGHPRPSDLVDLAMDFEKNISFFLPPWGIRLRRSTCACRSKQEHEEKDSSSAAAACSRPSPATPLDYIGTSFDPSTSGSEGFNTSPEIAPIKRLRTEDSAAPRYIVQSKVGAFERLPSVEAVKTTSKPIRRRGKKKTISELQAQERSLTEEKSLLVKMVEAQRKDMAILMAENRRLTSEAASLQMQMAPEAIEPAFLLPDLNEPVLMEESCLDT